MAFEALAISMRVLGFAVAGTARGFWGSVRRGPFSRWSWPGPQPESLVIAPQDIRTNDPTLAVDFYVGLFSFSGKTVEAEGRSPFELVPPSAAWARALHGFSWLRHLRAAETALARENARALVADWLTLESRHPAIAQDPQVTARRVISWVSHSPLILERADHKIYREFVRSLARQVKRLHYLSHDIAEGYPRLLAAIAVASAAISLDGQARLVRLASQRLEQELVRQILPDGGHISRNPALLPELLADLLPLVRAFSARGQTPPAALIQAIDRMMPMVRFFRHRDGALALFNGMGATPFDLVATVLAYDDTLGQPVRNAIHSGYQRLEGGSTVVLVDTGRAPPMAVSGQAHAGTLSFEISTGAARMVVNCGSIDLDDRWTQLARSTAAHSALVLEDTSTMRFLTWHRAVRYLGALVVKGPRFVAVERQETPESSQILCRHDGYDDNFGLLHERSLTLSSDGNLLVGRDRLIWSGAERQGRDQYAIRFHLHPGVSAEQDEDGRVVLTLADGDLWAFSSTQLVPDLMESIHLCDIYGRRRALQIVLSSTVHENSRVDWWFERLPPPPPSGDSDEPA